MRLRPLGRTGLEVSEMGLGGLFVSEIGGDYETSRGAVHAALDRGVTLFDTAPAYADGESVLGRALREDGAEARAAARGAPIVVSTKLGGRPRPFDPKDPAALGASFEESLRLLGRDAIDILFIHEPDRPGEYDWWKSREPLAGPVLDLLADLRDAGLVKCVGLAGTTVYEMVPLVATGLFDVVLTAFNYSLLFREAGPTVIAEATARGMGVLVGSPLQQGLFSRVWHAERLARTPWLSPARREQLLALYALLGDAGLSPPEAALRFVLSDPRVSSVLVGARNRAEVDASADAVEKGPLPAELLARLDAIAARVPFRPCEEPWTFPFLSPYDGPGPAR